MPQLSDRQVLTRIHRFLSWHLQHGRKERRDPIYGLTRTHDLPTTHLATIPSDAFSVTQTTQPITFLLEFATSGVAEGVKFEWGARGGPASCTIACINTDITQAAAGSTVVNDDQVKSDTLPNLFQVGKTHRVVWAINPGNGKARIWVDGKRVWAGQSVNQSLNGPWAAQGDGSIIITGTSVLARMEAYAGQLPSQFD